MSIYEAKAFIANGFPAGMKVSSTARLIFLDLCLQYDTRPGKKKSYPGMEELQRVTGKGRTTVQDDLKVLLNLGLIVQVQKGYRTKRAEYVPVYALALLNNKSVGISDTLEDNESAIALDSVGASDYKGLLYPLNGSAIPHTISTINTSKYDKYDVNRFNEVILQGLPTHLRVKLVPGKNLEEALDELELLNVSHYAIREHLNNNYWDNVHTPGAIVLRLLSELIAESKQRVE